MSFGEKIATARKKKGFSQEELAKKVDSIAVTIGRYERNEVKPSIDVANKIANALEVSLDFLVGNTDQLIDNNILKKVEQIQLLPDEDKNCVIKLLDAFLRDFNAKKAYS